MPPAPSRRITSNGARSRVGAGGGLLDMVVLRGSRPPKRGLASLAAGLWHGSRGLKPHPQPCPLVPEKIRRQRPRLSRRWVNCVYPREVLSSMVDVPPNLPEPSAQGTLAK